MNTGDVGRKLERVMQSVKTKEQTIVAINMLRNACMSKTEHTNFFYKWFELGMLSNQTIAFEKLPFVAQIIHFDHLIDAIWPE